MSAVCVFVPVANNFVQPQTASKFGYHSFGEPVRFIYCLLQKIKADSSHHLIKQLDQYMVANHTRFSTTEDKKFLSGTRVMIALNKVGS